VKQFGFDMLSNKTAIQNAYRGTCVCTSITTQRGSALVFHSLQLFSF